MVLPKDFLINLQANGIAKVTVGVVVGHMPPEEEKEGEGEAAKPPEGYGGLPQEAVLRAVITDVLTGASRDDFAERRGRKKLKQKILKALQKQTDVPVEEVLLSDVAVQ